MTTRPAPAKAGADVAEWRLHPWWERVLVGIAMTAIVLPGLGTLAGLGADAATSEKDDPSMAADGSAGDDLASRLRTWISGFEDRFAFRGGLVRGQAAIRYRWLGVSPQPEVIRGRDGWLFYADNGGLDDYLRTMPFSDDDLRLWASTLQHTQDALAARGIAYVFVVAPDKHVIYPEHMPTSLQPASGPSRADQLLAHLAATTSVQTVDLRPVLAAAKATDRIYHRTDSHWNDVGALVATHAILERLQAIAPDVEWLAPPPRLDGLTRRERVTPGMDLAVMLRLAPWLPETRIELVPREPRVARVVEPVPVDPEFGEPRVVTRRADGRGPRALVYRDSFGSALIPFLAEAFGQAVFLWEYDVDPAHVRAERPDVVIHEWASRRLHTRAPYDAVAAADKPDGPLTSPRASSAPSASRISP
jgi:alginate O-acetyltransferase complex protein AlgJ